MAVIKKGSITSARLKTVDVSPSFKMMDRRASRRSDDVSSDPVEDRISEYRNAQKKAENASSSKGAFLANMSHEIRTPMNAILGYSQMLLREANLNVPHKEYLEKIILSSRHLLSLVNDVLDLSKIEVGRMVVVESVFDLEGLLKAVQAMLGPRATDKGLTLHVRPASILPKYIDADEVKLRQILVNLVANAIKFTTDGGVIVYIDVVSSRRGDDKHLLLIDVVDTGPGIESESAERLFRPFQQLSDDSKTRGPEGTGLGLAISREYARLLGGDLTLESSPGEGCKFTLQIPVGIDHAEELVPSVSERSGRAIGIISPSTPVRILVVDDNEDANQLTERFLSSIGFEIAVAVDGEDALDVFFKFLPHLVLMDRRMPRMDGLEAMRHIKNSEEGRDVPVVIVTASVFDEDYKECMVCGADAFIRKPYLEEELLGEISRLADIRYDYEKKKDKRIPVVKPEHFEALSKEENEAMVSAIMKGDLDGLLEVFDQLTRLDKPVVESLKGMAKAYKYDELLKLIPTSEPGGSGPTVAFAG